jgi:uncharacterized BrkB/YihY/UPF0761 family membrane protein
MNRGSTLFLKVALIIIGLVVLAICVVLLPLLIMNNDAEDGYKSISIALYVPAVPFFIALYQAWKLLSYIDASTAFSGLSVSALKTIKGCAIAIAAMFALYVPHIAGVAEKDDAPGVVVIALVIIFFSTVIAVFAAVLQKLIRNGLDLKSENDLTV